MTLADQGLRQIPGALAGPEQRRLGVSSGRGVDESLQVLEERPVLLGEPLPPLTRAADMRLGGGVGRRSLGGLALGDTRPDRGLRQPRGLGDGRDPAPAEGECFTGRPTPPHPLVHDPGQSLILPSHCRDRFVGDHPDILCLVRQIHQLILERLLSTTPLRSPAGFALMRDIGFRNSLTSLDLRRVTWTQLPRIDHSSDAVNHCLAISCTT